MTDREFKKKRRDDYRKYLVSLRPNFLVTVNYKKPLPGGAEDRRNAMLTHLRHWNRNILEMLFGKKFVARNRDDAFSFAAIMEVGSDLGKEHYHILVRVPYRRHFWVRFSKLAKKLWPGTDDVKVEFIRDLVKAVAYCTKGLIDNPDSILLSGELRKPVV